MLNARALGLIGQLNDEHQRAGTARALAAELGAEDLIVFTPDPEIGVLLPAPGFPQTLRPGRVWRAFLDACTRMGRYTDRLLLDGRDQPACGVTAADGTVLVVLGGTPRPELLSEVLLLAPLLSASFGRERAMIAASGHATAARQAAASAGQLAAALDTVRRDLQVALAQAQQAVHERNAFISVAAHELNTPLTSLKGIAQLQRRRLERMDTVDPAWARETLDRIDDQASKVARLVRQLLDVSRLDSGQLPLTRAETDVVQLVGSVVEIMQAQGDKHRLQVNAPAALVAWIDGLRLEQVLTNLLDNAMKYSSDGGLIDVVVRPHGERFDIVVMDDGPGIPEAQQEQIFDRFHRAHSGDHSSGLGIGLFVSRQIVELHGGRITAANRDDRGGAQFTITLPIAPADGTSPARRWDATPAAASAHAGNQ